MSLSDRARTQTSKWLNIFGEIWKWLKIILHPTWRRLRSSAKKNLRKYQKYMCKACSIIHKIISGCIPAKGASTKYWVNTVKTNTDWWIILHCAQAWCCWAHHSCRWHQTMPVFKELIWQPLTYSCMLKIIE